MRILTEMMVTKAIEMVRPAAETILSTAGTTWGPRWVEGWVAERDLTKRISFNFGTSSRDWNPKWGDLKDFSKIASAKLDVVWREGMSTRLVVAIQPWTLRPSEYLYSGGVIRGSICVAVSGANGATDEAIAEIVLSSIIMLAQLEADERMMRGHNII